MTKIDTREGENGLSGRHFAMRDVRFAGTVAAGLIAGVLGVGALTAPLLGWTEWPSSPAGNADSVTTLREPVVTPTREKPPAAKPTPGARPLVVSLPGTQSIGVGPTGTTIALPAPGGGTPASGGTGGAAPSGGASNGGGSRPSTGGGAPRPRTGLQGGSVRDGAGNPDSGFGSVQFTGVDSDNDGMSDAFERQYDLNPNNAADGTVDSDGDGISN